MSAATPALSAAERRQRNLAILLLAAVMAMFGILLHQFWWKPWAAARAQADQSAERQARAQALVAQRGVIESALARAEAAARQQPLWLPEASIAQAVDGMSERVDQAVALVSGEGRRCKVVSRNPSQADAASARPRRAVLALRLRCGNAELLQLLHLLETSQPPLLVDELNISAPPQYPGTIITAAAGVLDVGFNVSGYVQAAPVVEGAP
ncbi:hypothetical protein EBB59_09560 [Lysobacter pythonis]|uniref:General secretion pathway protein GspM n=1 Tax=Solilutibacter pythonis TaxID=2483112 RepID=A0A3M2HTX7_9GAMM|nr:type II secretion system protein GspM [Lysobacter pythonis]RMH90859.1 hypothetical protein EBB59_09560 [Lysobacter pythonis]